MHNVRREVNKDAGQLSVPHVTTKTSMKEKIKK